MCYRTMVPGYRPLTPATKRFTRHLRRNPTEAELRLSYFLKARRLRGFKFRRQFPIGDYIADFCCYERRLVVELDGGQHQSRQRQDRLRTEFINGERFRVLRFWNPEVLSEVVRVLEVILEALAEELPTPRPPPGGRGVRGAAGGEAAQGRGEAEPRILAFSPAGRGNDANAIARPRPAAGVAPISYRLSW